MGEPAAVTPYDWVGRQVEAAIIEGGVYGDSLQRAGLVAYVRVGTLEEVNDLGIVASLGYAPDYEVEDHEPIRTFYPWSAVLWLRLHD